MDSVRGKHSEPLISKVASSTMTRTFTPLVDTGSEKSEKMDGEDQMHPSDVMGRKEASGDADDAFANKNMKKTDQFNANVDKNVSRSNMNRSEEKNKKSVGSKNQSNDDDDKDKRAGQEDVNRPEDVLGHICLYDMLTPNSPVQEIVCKSTFLYDKMQDYAHRPKELQDVNLYTFIANYEVRK